MIKICFFTCVTALLFCSCSNKSSTLQKYFNTNVLREQLFVVNIDRDTVLLTRSGCVIKIPQGSLESKGKEVKLEVKEALSIDEMVLAGLTTMSGNKPLSSGGMIFIDAAGGYEVKIVKPLEVKIPTKSFNNEMQVYSGEISGDGSIDWQNPAPLPANKLTENIAKGKTLFNNCRNCHKIHEDFTGPALNGITEKRSRRWLYEFTRNPAKSISETMALLNKADSIDRNLLDNYYGYCSFNQFKPTMMTPFSSLTDGDLDAIYAYIKVESDKRPDLKGNKNCCDSCTDYLLALTTVNNVSGKQMPMPENEFFSLDDTIPVPANANIDSTDSDSIMDTTEVYPGYVSSTYYTININTFGWYNIDILMKEESGCVPSKLMVRIQGSYQSELTIALIIPPVKAFVTGGLLRDKKMYGFDDADGNIPLPQNMFCRLIAYAEQGDKLYFGKAAFMSKTEQVIDISLTETDPQTMKDRIKEMNLSDVSLEIEKIRVPPPTIRDTTRSLNSQEDLIDRELNKLRPKKCNCGLPKL
jgi:cytochrome c2